MKVFIESYREFEISFDTDKSLFYCFSDPYDNESTSKSYESVKKYIDDHIKKNKIFKPFVVHPVPGSWKQKEITITGIRKDKGFAATDENGINRKVSI